ncbi:MAG: hypothetical protein U0104_15170 [Gemmatimonadales bacterium]
MPPTDQELFAIAQRAATAFAGLPHVHGVGLGGRERAGKPTGEIVLKVLVDRKVPLGQLDPSARVPASFEGIPTDVIQVGRPVPHTVPSGYLVSSEDVDGDMARERPLKGGTVISAEDDRSWGTLGFIVEALEDSRKVFGVTNHHVVFEDSNAQVIGFKVGQPEAKASCTACCRGVIGAYAGGHESLDKHNDPQANDYALIQLDPGLEWLNEIKEVGVVEDFYDVKVADIVGLDFQVVKRSAFTRLTGGTVQSIGVVAVPHVEPMASDIRRYWQHFRDYSMLIRPNPDPTAPAAPITFSVHGDSGAAVLTPGRKVVALLWGGVHDHTETDGDPATELWGYSLAIPIKRVLDDASSRLGFTLRILPTAGEGIVNTVPDLGAAAAEPRAERTLQRDLDATEQGRAFLAAWLRHSGELNAIVQDQRRVATVWHRHNGPALLRMVARAPQQPMMPLPTEIDGLPVRDGLQAFLAQVERHASEPLRRDLLQHRALLLSLPGSSYEEALGRFVGGRQ